MDRLEPARYVRPGIRTYVPTRFVFVCCNFAARNAGQVQSLVVAEWCTLAVRRTRGEWSTDKITTGESIVDFWAHIKTLGHNCQRLYIIAEDGAESITALDFWSQVDTGSFSLHPPDTIDEEPKRKGENPQRPLPLVMADGCDIIGFRWQHGSARWLSPRNHGLDEWETIGRAMRPDLPAPATRSDRRTHIDDSLPMDTRAILLRTCYQRYCEWWTTLDCGPWSDTSGGLGMSWWKKTISRKTVLIHDNDAAHAAECDSAYGARMQSFFHGRVSLKKTRPTDPIPISTRHIHSRLYHVDTTAMYASIMRDQRFPTKIAGQFADLSIDRLMALCETMDVIAHVRVKSHRGSLPYRIERGVCYPRGEWDCWMTTPEIIDCTKHGEILECHKGYRYKTGNCMRIFADEVLRARELATMTADPIGKIIAKGVGNALTGRLARRRSRWLPSDDQPCRMRWGWWMHSASATAAPVKYRSLCGRVYRWDVDGRRIAGLTAIYSHITAYGRVIAAKILAAAGPMGCVAWDTDGGWMTQSGYDNLTEAGLLDNSGPGSLRLVGEAERGQWRSAKIHWIDDEYTISGVRSGFAVDSTGIVRYEDYLNPARQGIDPTREGVSIRRQAVPWEAFAPSVPVGVDGWASPLVVSRGVVAASGTLAASSLL